MTYKRVKLSIYIIILFSILYCHKTTAQELSMRNGLIQYRYYSGIERIPKKDFLSIMKTDEESFEIWKKSRRHHLISLGIVTSGTLGFGSLFLSTWGTDKKSARTWSIIGWSASYLASVGFYGSSFKLKKKAMKNYNDKQNDQSLNIGLTNDGVGLVLEF